MNLERIWPVKENLEVYLDDYPEHRIRYELINELIKDSECADISCGAGYGTYLMSSKAKFVHGFDVSEEALEYARNNFLEQNTEFSHIDALKDKKFDFVSSVETLEHMSEEEGDIFLKTLKEALRDDGVLFITTPLNNTPYKDNVTPYHIREYSEEEFKMKLQKNGFVVEKFFGLSNDVSENMNSKIFGVSPLSIIKTGLHRLIPKPIRNILSGFILKKGHVNTLKNCKIVEQNLNNAFCQIAICKLI